MNFEKIKELYETDKLPVQMVPYVKPLLEHIEVLEQKVSDLFSELDFENIINGEK